MPDEALESLRRECLESGIAGDQVDRLIGELQDHYEDLLEEARLAGLAADTAREDALRRLGSTDQLLETALTLVPAEYFAAQNVLVDDRACIARWSAAIAGSALFTAALLFLMQVAIHA